MKDLIMMSQYEIFNFFVKCKNLPSIISLYTRPDLELIARNYRGERGGGGEHWFVDEKILGSDLTLKGLGDGGRVHFEHLSGIS